jgi:MFS family permease
MVTERLIDGPAAWRRLAAIMALSTTGNVGMWSVVVALPHVQAEFGATRSEAALPYALTMLGFAAGSVLLGRATDRFGAMRAVLFGATMLATGYVLSGLAPSLLFFAVAHGVLIGMLGGAATFGPLMADASLWFHRRRGIAVALAACGNYLAGAIWPPLLDGLIGVVGWRMAHVAIGVTCLSIMVPLAFALRAPPPLPRAGTSAAAAGGTERPLGLSPNALTAVLCVAGLGCCVAMAMPQVHIVAYCGDLGYGVARGTEMLSLMLLCGVVSRIASGFIADRIGGLATLLLGSVLQGVALALYLFFDGLASLFVVSALFGLFQGGIVPSYAVVVREHFPAREAATRVGVVLMATMVGMALGGWLSGLVFDVTGSYRAAFLNGVAWNAMNVLIISTLLIRARGGAARLA